MWNQTISSQRVPPYYSYASKKKQELAHLSKYKIFILMLSRSTYRIMKQTMSQMLKVQAHQEKLLVKLWNVMNRSAVDMERSALYKLKQNLIVSRAKENKLKNFSTLLQRMMKYKLKKSFTLIALFSQRKSQSIVSSIDQMRKLLFCRKIERVLTGKKKQYLLKLVDYSHYVDRVHKKVKTVGMIGRSFVKNIKLLCFNKLVKNYYSNRSQNTLIEQGESQQNLLKRINDLETQLQLKSTSITHLQQQLSDLKMQQTANNNNNSFSEYSSTAYNKSGHGRNKSLSRSRKDNTSLNDSGFDFSIGSILGNSFSVNKSRSKHVRGAESVASGDCGCEYKEKYIKMKNTNESLKNQLQIVKEELDVAKDLNDHFTNQIKLFFGGEKDSIQLDRLKKQSKDLQRQRQQLRNKLIKYQHHINTLKSQFKSKIQELYRKVKKQR